MPLDPMRELVYTEIVTAPNGLRFRQYLKDGVVIGEELVTEEEELEVAV